MENNNYFVESFINLPLDGTLNNLVEKKNLSLITYQLSKEEEEIIIQIFEKIIKKTIISNKINHLTFCIKEILENAKKANLKRVFFIENNLNIYSPVDYSKGIIIFKNEVCNNFDNYVNLLKKHNYYIKIIFKIKNKDLIVIVQNNTEILDIELENAKDKISGAKKFDKIEDALNEIYKSKEGAGLGLIISTVILKELGFKNAISIMRKKGYTEVKITLKNIY